jgi:hypothetical protein
MVRPPAGSEGKAKNRPSSHKENGWCSMSRKDLERRSKKYAPVQDVSVSNWHMDAEDFHQKYKTHRVGVKKGLSPAAGRKNRIMIYGPEPDGTYVIEFRTAAGEALAISIAARETRVIRHFQERMPCGLFVPDTP